MYIWLAKVVLILLVQCTWFVFVVQYLGLTSHSQGFRSSRIKIFTPLIRGEIILSWAGAGKAYGLEVGGWRFYFTSILNPPVSLSSGLGTGLFPTTVRRVKLSPFLGYCNP